MKIQFLNGGLANQVFQYIFVRYYELSRPGEIMYMDDSYFALHTVHNGYELEKVFGLKPHMLSEYFDEESWNFILEEKRRGKSVPAILCENGMQTCMIVEAGNSYEKFNPFEGQTFPIPGNSFYPEIIDYPGNVYYHGYWINQEWFQQYKNIFLEELQFVDTSDKQANVYYEQIRQTQSVSIHIRRGDYVSLGWAYSIDNYKCSVEQFLKNVPGKWNLFVFSDDIDWCREHSVEMGFDLFASVAFVEGNVQGKNYLDLWLMSNCKGMIMSNSAFCYLAALLNTNLQYVYNPTKRRI